MNTNKLQTFASESRTELMASIAVRVRTVLAPMSSARADVPEVVGRLEEIIREAGGGDAGRAAVVERYAYRWFNRIIAFRYMDVLDYTDAHVVSAEDVSATNGLPEVLSDALRGVYDPDVFENDRVNRDAGVQSTVEALIDGTRTSDDPQGEAYGLLLQAYCRHWHESIPSMFEGEENLDRKVDELLMPTDLLASDSVPRRALEAMTPEDCIIVGEDGERRGNVEVIGWLYQFYISQRKDEVMAGFRKRAKAGAAEIPAATQLFTPDWIVQYLVQNTVGRLWMQSHPESQLYKKWEYYIDPTSSVSDETNPASSASPYQGEVSAQPTEGVSDSVLTIDTPEDLTVCDPACGSGHMLTYAFDLLYDIYEEQGYGPNEIPGLILEHNLYGMEIDERAANLASFALTMKARDRYRRFFRKHVRPNIQRIEPVSFTDDEVHELNQQYAVDLDPEIWNTYAQADILGSLIQPSPQLASLASQVSSDAEAFAPNVTEGDNSIASEQPALLSDTLVNHETLAEKAKIVFTQTRYLARKYTAVVANPPYMGSGNMGAELKDYVNRNYKGGKADLFAAFILRNLQLIQPNALLGMITMQSWMFLSSFENLRKDLLATNTIETMAHLGAGAFDSIGGEVVSTTAFTIRRAAARNGERGSYIRLVDVQGDANQAKACSRIAGSPRRGELSARPTEGSDTSKIFTVSQSDFTQIPESAIAYWLPKRVLAAFSKGVPLRNFVPPRQGLATADNNRFVRLWWEVNYSCSSFKCDTREQAAASGKRWFPYNKGGEFRKWYGNRDYLVNWEKDGSEIRSFGTECGGRVKSRPQNIDFYFSQSISWSTVTSGNPSFRFDGTGVICDQTSGFLASSSDENLQVLLSILNSSTAVKLLNVLGSSTHYMQGPVGYAPIKRDIGIDAIEKLIASSRFDWDSYETSWDFARLTILKYAKSSQSDSDSFNMGLSLSEIVPNCITRCKVSAREQQSYEVQNNELVADAYGVRDEVSCDVPIERVSLKRNPAFVYPKNTPAERDELMARDLVKELISYAVGCVFGRYSIDKPGLILASQGETLDDYLSQIPEPRFMPDEDNVIPVTSDEWFEDDIVSRFRKFLGIVYGEEHLSENVAYIESMLGKDLRKYFVNDFYNDHVKMYKNRPIYWMYSSRTDNKGSFKALVYLHRYTPQTTSNVLGYLRDYTAKLDAQSKRLLASDSARDVREGEKLQSAITECRTYEDRILYPLATRNLEIDLDDGVLVNYLRLGDALRSIPALERKRKEVTTWTWPHHKLEG
ncbi:BREX-1 system adenine-specific DNA-methyltransferase PglX [Bifidobacterium callimiconis]|uniref:site-specific DNA-methyltransferase (adenine-specific) n=1 Tax=Bifidobacterium callimiconis TaxID=2306973 RepID=A0A430FHW3_9BIFI|nr:BREX-1 system adenine-specific DNA-methyltransferase PglX [Bifidobacterium callimiconis]RSX52436.1 N-6 DNA Methylase [Bifidobacterium callimiconis]